MYSLHRSVTNTLSCEICYKLGSGNPSKIGSATAKSAPVVKVVTYSLSVSSPISNMQVGSAHSQAWATRDGVPRITQYGPTKTTERANSALYIDPATGDIVIDSTGKELGMDPVQQRIQILLNTRLGSIEADQTIGLKTPKKITSDIGRKLAVLVQNALKPMIDDGTIELTRVTAYIQQ